MVSQDSLLVRLVNRVDRLLMPALAVKRGRDRQAREAISFFSPGISLYYSSYLSSIPWA
jgi:hypothetical protein